MIRRAAGCGEGRAGRPATTGTGAAGAGHSRNAGQATRDEAPGPTPRRPASRLTSVIKGVCSEERSVKKKKKKSLSFKIGKFSYNSLFQHPHPPTLRKVVVDGVCAAPCLPLPTRTPYQGTNLLHLGFSSPAPFCFKTSGQISRLVDTPPASCTCRDY